MAITDDFIRESLATAVRRGFASLGVIGALPDLFIKRELPKHIWADNGQGFTSKAIQKWLNNLKVGLLFIEPVSAWENGYNESFINGRLRDELLNGEIFHTLEEAKTMIERWRVHYNTKTPHTSLGYRSPETQTLKAPNTIMTYKN